MRYGIECSAEQAVVVARACELLARVDLGHIEYIAESLIGHELAAVDYPAKYAAACKLKYEFFGLAPSANLGLHNPKVPEKARIAWDIANAIRNRRGDAASKEGYPEVRQLSSTRGKISVLDRVFAEHAGRTMFVLQWADYEEKAGRCHGGQEFFNVAPETPDDFIAEGWKYLGVLEHINKMSLLMLLRRAALADGEKESAYWDAKHAEAFAYGCTMPAAGHGVSWFDSHKHWEEFKNTHLDAIPELDPVDYPELEDPDV